VVAAAYAIAWAALWGPLTMRDGYVITGAALRSWFSKTNLIQGGEYMSTAPKVGYSQFLRNVVFWMFVISIKVCDPSLPAPAADYARDGAQAAS
jgi:hypothetical protein